MRSAEVLALFPPSALQRAPAITLPRATAWLVPPALYLGVALLFTWPLALHLTDSLPGAREADALLHVHRLWWVPHMLGRGINPYAWSDLLRYPDGDSQYLETLIPLMGLATWPARVLGGSLFGYNVAVLLALTLNGWAACLLVLDLTQQRGAALVAGLSYCVSPYVIGHLDAGHLNLIQGFWPPLFLLCLLRALTGQGRRWRWAAAAGVCLAGTGYTDLQWSLSAGLLALGVTAARLWAAVQSGGWVQAARPPLLAATLAAGVGLVLSLPLLLGIVSDVQGGAEVPSGIQSKRNSATLAVLVAPQPYHPLWRQAVDGWYTAMQLNEGAEQFVALGYVSLALAGVGLADRRTRRLGWLLGVLLFLGLALGPSLHLAARFDITPLPPGVPMPYEVLSVIPLLKYGRAPARFVAPATLCLAVLVGYGVAALARRSALRLAPAVVAALLVFELLPIPYALTQPEVPGLYRALAERGCSGAVLEIPVEPTSDDEKARLYFQVAHGCPISGGYVSRDQSHTSIQLAWRAFAKLSHPSRADVAKMRATLRREGFTEIALWWDAYDTLKARKLDEDAVERLAGANPVYSSAEGQLFVLR